MERLMFAPVGSLQKQRLRGRVFRSQCEEADAQKGQDAREQAHLSQAHLSREHDEQRK